MKPLNPSLHHSNTPPFHRPIPPVLHHSSAPTPHSPDSILLAHGGGGRLTRELIEQEILTRFGGGVLRGLPDAATLPPVEASIVFTTDSYVVQPLEFPGGNIGHLAVHGTVNDIAVCGGIPKWLSVGLILEEGLPRTVLARVLDAIRDAAGDCGIDVVTGDTKVVARGQCDGLYVNTAGLGVKMPEFGLTRESLREGDVVLASGTLADHGMAVLACRRNINIGNGPSSDTGPVHRLVQAARPFAARVRFMRDPTRGGAAAVLNEMTDGLLLDILVRERDLPVAPGTRAVAEMLGIDPLHAASEGRVLLVCDPGVATAILKAWAALPEGRGSCAIGTVRGGKGRVVLETLAGGHRLVDVPRGELLPRIC